jgi:cell division protein FtsW
VRGEAPVRAAGPKAADPRWTRLFRRDRGGLPVDRWLLVTTLLLVGLGVVMVYSASGIRAQDRFADPAFFLKRQMAWALVGLLVMPLAMRCDLHRLQRLTPVLLLGAVLLLLLVWVPGVGMKINGARRWVRLLGFSFQPAEFAKLALILFLASYFARRQDRLASFLDGFLPPLFVAGVLAALVIAQPNFGTACVMLFVAGVLFFIGGARTTHMAATCACAVPGLVFLMFQFSHARTRILALLDPSRVSPKATYQLGQSIYALGPGGLLGRGLGESMQKLFYLPEPHTDFIFAIVGEEIGFLGTLGVLLLFGIFLWRGTRAAIRAGDRYASLLAMGITALIVGQAVLNVGVVSGVLPTTGVPLPFLSFGGSSLVITLAGAGILLNVSRRAEGPELLARPGHDARPARALPCAS